MCSNGKMRIRKYVARKSTFMMHRMKSLKNRNKDTNSINLLVCCCYDIYDCLVTLRNKYRIYLWILCHSNEKPVINMKVLAKVQWYYYQEKTIRIRFCEFEYTLYLLCRRRIFRNVWTNFVIIFSLKTSVRLIPPKRRNFVKNLGRL